MKILDVQSILAQLGYKPGPLDGIYGRQTAEAIKAFQARSGLVPDAVVGPLTAAALLTAFPLDDVDPEPPRVWYAEAARQYGTREIPGPASNHTILQWANDRGIPYNNDDIPWCGLFVAHCIGSTLPSEPLPSNPLGARQWLKFGISIEPTRGAVLVFWRGSPQSWKGHVGFYAGEDDDAFCVLGGNQRNEVSLAWIAKNRLLDARWPATVAPPVGDDPVILARSATQLSINEA